MWPSLFDDPKAKESFERLRNKFDPRIAFLVAAVDSDYRTRLKTGYEPAEAYARSVGDIARIHALVEGYSPDQARERQAAVYEETLRVASTVGMADPVHPHAERILPT